MNKKIFALLVVLNLSFYNVFAENERGEDRNERDGERGRVVENLCPQINFGLHRGVRNDDVKKLQKFLKQKLNLSDNDFLVTGTFGKITEKYVKEFQKRNNINPTGVFGNLTRKKVLENCSTSTLPIQTPVSTPATTSTTTTPVTLNNKYKNGTYNVTTSYMSPGGLDNLGVQITLLNDKITNIVVTNGAKDRTSTFYQDGFISGISSNVVAKNISNLSIGVVSGASLTSRSFNEALTKIRAQALN